MITSIYAIDTSDIEIGKFGGGVEEAKNYILKIAEKNEIKLTKSIELKNGLLLRFNLFRHENAYKFFSEIAKIDDFRGDIPTEYRLVSNDIKEGEYVKTSGFQKLIKELEMITSIYSVGYGKIEIAKFSGSPKEARDYLLEVAKKYEITLDKESSDQSKVFLKLKLNENAGEFFNEIAEIGDLKKDVPNKYNLICYDEIEKGKYVKTGIFVD